MSKVSNEAVSAYVTCAPDNDTMEQSCHSAIESVFEEIRKAKKALGDVEVSPNISLRVDRMNKVVNARTSLRLYVNVVKSFDLPSTF
jgi:hypothetical protein